MISVSEGMSLDQVDVIVVGAGAVGLAVAAEVAALCGEPAVLVLERHSKFGQDTSSRNSEVIHAGMYYPTGSLKALHCVEGNRLMYEFCAMHSIPHRQIGKLIIARDHSEMAAIEAIFAQGIANGVRGMTMLDQAGTAAMEPGIRAVAAIHSEFTGIIDTHKLMAMLESLGARRGAMAAYRHEVTGVHPVAAGYEVSFCGPDGITEKLGCRWLINCAGLYADRIAAMCGIDPDTSRYRIYPVKGEYFSVSARKSGLISHLIYPPPLHGLKSLGTHVTKSLDGRARLGPNVATASWHEDYDVDPAHLEEFYQAAHSYLPFIEREDLQPDMAGMRPKLQTPGSPVADFVICHETARGLPGLINLVGIESPGLTACLSIARRVAGLVAVGL